MDPLVLLYLTISEQHGHGKMANNPFTLAVKCDRDLYVIKTEIRGLVISREL